MKVLIIGSGAREHTIAWKLRQSPRLRSLYVAPGNAGTAQIADNLPVRANDVEAVASAAEELRPDLVVVGPEEPLARGLADRLAVAGIPTFGPSQSAARIESSKAFAKELMQAHGIPTAASRTFDSVEPARDYVRGCSTAQVVKADGLAAGKGAIVTADADEALAALERMMVEETFGEAGRRVVIEERLFGPEVTAHAFSDGRAVVPMPFSCDHKPVFDNDEGPNTGGMGAYSPAYWLDPSAGEWIDEHVTRATVRAMYDEGLPYRGVLYPGMMVTADGPKVIEFNCRFGDPEAQVLLPRLESDLLEVLLAVANESLADVSVEWSDDACVGVVLASGGYPGEYKTGLPIEGLDDVEPDAIVFHAGTARRDDGRVVTAGGRVLTVAATGPTLEAAREKAYRNVERIRFDGVHYRRDIGARKGRPMP